MANPLRGEVDLVVGEKTYLLRLSINGVVEAETLLDKSVNEIIQSIDRMGTLRALLWAALREHHPSLSLFDAGDIIGIAGAENVGFKVGEAIKAAFPEAKGGDDSRPQTAAPSGTGSNS
jgi:hypothetical protein